MKDFESQPREISFSDHLVESNISSAHEGRDKLFEIRNNPDKIVRMESFKDLEKRYKGAIDPIAVAELGQKLYAEFERDYGVVVPVEFVIGKHGRNKDVIYGITDKIEGADLNKIEPTPEITEQVEKLYAKIARYYLSKLSKKDEPYLADLNNTTQYVYGKRKGDEIPKIYLVDTDLYIRSEKFALYNVVVWLFRHMSSAEKKYGTEFTEARDVIQQILDAPLPDYISEKEESVIRGIIEKMRGYLEGSIRIDDEDAHPLFSHL